MKDEMPDREILTVGHSTHSLEEFLELLQTHEVKLLADVRIVPASRRMPHFAKQALAESLRHEGIEYVHVKELGGWRRPVRGSPNTGWTSKAFQGYADHMRTPEFREALERLTASAATLRTAVVCAEALWWRCHRRLIADALLVRGWTVRHIDSAGRLREHTLPAFAVVENGELTYPAAQRSLNV